MNKLFVLLLLSVPTWASDCTRYGTCPDEIDINIEGEIYNDIDVAGDTIEGDEINVGGDEINVASDTTFSNPRRAPNNYLVMQNQVEACGRTFGFSGSNTSGGWAFGIPIPRSWTPTCDLWKAAEEAQQNGFVYVSYMFQCSIKAVRKVLGAACTDIEARALDELTPEPEYVPEPESEPDARYEELQSLYLSAIDRLDGLERSQERMRAPARPRYTDEQRAEVARLLQ